MKRLFTLLLVSLLMFAVSCKKNPTATPATTTLEFTVIDGVTGMAPPGGAAVVLYATAADVTGGSPKYSVSTDQNGKVKLTVNYLSQYYIIAISGAERNYFNGLIPVGIFKTQAEIQDSPAQTPAAVVGGVKFRDTNGDGIVSAADNVPAPAVSIVANTNNTFNITIY